MPRNRLKGMTGVHSKKREQQQLQAEWDAMIARHAKPLERGAQSKGTKPPKLAPHNPKVAALLQAPRTTKFETMKGSTARKDSPTYTGTKMKGIGVMHKSNAVPVFSDEEATDLARMRR